MRAVDRSSSEKIEWGTNCKSWVLLDEENLNIKSERVPPGETESRHIHQSTRQFFYVLSGEAKIEIDGEIHEILAGQGIEVPHNTPHEFMNKSDTYVDFLVISTADPTSDREHRPREDAHVDS